MELIVDFPRERPRPITPPRRAAPRVNVVSFMRHVETRIVENLSLEHKDRLWFSGGEMAWFKCDVTRTLRDIKSSGMTVGQFAEVHVEDTSLFLGLEGYMTADTPSEIKHRRRTCWDTVLWEQLCQLNAGVHDPEAIAVVAKEASKFSRKRARIVGLIHAPKTRSPGRICI